MTSEAEDLVLYVVYDHPRDCPEPFVARAQIVRRGCQDVLIGPIVARGPTLTDVRRDLLAERPWLTCLERDEDDDPVIAEIWL